MNSIEVLSDSCTAEFSPWLEYLRDEHCRTPNYTDCGVVIVVGFDSDGDLAVWGSTVYES